MIRKRTYNLRPSKPAPPRLLDPRLLVLALFLFSTGVVLLGTQFSTHVATAQAAPQTQRRRPARRRARRPSGPRAPAIDYTKFSHATKGHYEDCASCHMTDNPKLPKITLAKPDIREYPDHPSCTNCHRQQFFRGPFRGTAPAICADCHQAAPASKYGPRVPFPKPQQPSQFADVFPHANHGKSTSLKLFAPVMGQTKVKQQDTCYYCHKLDKSEHKPPAGAQDAFAPPAGTFMLTPTSHASCFQCHWQKGVENKDIEPLSNQCAECHNNLALAHQPKPMTVPAPTATPAKPAATPAAKPAATPTPKPAPKKPAADEAHASFTSANWRAPIAFVPAVSLEQQQKLPERTSPKFRHELNANPKDDPHQYRPDVKDDKGEPVKITCLTCHVAVKTSASLESLRQPDNKVKVPSCASTACHTALSGPNLNLSILKELRARDKDKTFDCALCHTPPNSTSKLFPCDHYEVVYQTAIKESKDNKAPDSLIKLIQKSPCKSILP